MSPKKESTSTQELKNAVLAKEEQKEYRSSKYAKIETQVKDALGRQATDDALRDISIGALVI
jgi:hypothetical protein